MSISVVMITYNDAERIRPCLESVRWADEIVVVDLGSSDDTPSICREFTARVYSHAWVPCADPIRSEVVALASNDWVLMLDPDERVMPELAGQLQSLADVTHVDVVLIPYWFMCFGERRSDDLAHYDAMPRFFRKGSLHWPSEVHTLPDITHLRHVRLDPADGHYILHDGWRSVDEIQDKTRRYTEQEARLLSARHVRFTWAGLMGSLGREVVRGLVHGGYRDGTTGLMHVGFRVIYRFIVWARLWELEGHPHDADRRIARFGAVLSIPLRLPYRVYRALRGF